MFEVSDSVVGRLMLLYKAVYYEVTGQKNYSKALISPKRSRWRGVFAKLHVLLAQHNYDSAEYMRWAMATDKSTHNQPNILVSSWRMEAYAQYRKKNKVGQVVDGQDLNSKIECFEADMLASWDLYFEHKDFCADYQAFILHNYLSLPPAFLCLDATFIELCQSGWVPTSDKTIKVFEWRESLKLNPTLTNDMVKLRESTYAATYELATA